MRYFIFGICFGILIIGQQCVENIHFFNNKSILSTNPEFTYNKVSSNKVIYYTETGHTLQDPFLSYYQQHRGLTRLGYPITEAMDHEGWHVQYFEYGRLEVHPENTSEYFITIGWLGQLSHRTQPPILHFNTNHRQFSSKFFNKTGHSISGSFLDFFEANGGTVQFGYPISEAFMHKGAIMQDFQSARLIWQPLLHPSAQVALEPLGENYFLNSGLSLDLLQPIAMPLEAKVQFFDSTILPSKATVRLDVESTPNADIIRVNCIIFENDIPVVGYAPKLSWNDKSNLLPHNNRLLPPTRLNGKTHTLINTSNFEWVNFILYDNEGKDILAIKEYWVPK